MGGPDYVKEKKKWDIEQEAEWSYVSKTVRKSYMLSLQSHPLVLGIWISKRSLSSLVFLILILIIIQTS